MDDLSRMTRSTSSSMKEELRPITDLRQTLSESVVLSEFRTFLRTKFDRNKSDNPEFKKSGEQWLDFVMVCEQVFDLPESEVDPKINIMIRVGTQFLGKPPDGYNMALKNQLNRKELISHCQSLAIKSCLVPDESLLRDGYEYVWAKLEQKHDLFKKTARPVTRLAMLLCSLS